MSKRLRCIFVSLALVLSLVASPVSAIANQQPEANTTELITGAEDENPAKEQADGQEGGDKQEQAGAEDEATPQILTEQTQEKIKERKSQPIPENSYRGYVGESNSLPYDINYSLEAAVDSVIEPYITATYSTYAVPGAVVLVAKDGKIIFEKAYGYAFLNDVPTSGPASLLSDGARAVNAARNAAESTAPINGERLAEPVEMTKDTLFDLASITKIMATTQSVMKLVSEGKIDVNEKVATYIPQFGTGAGGSKKDVTVAELLTHSSGISQWEAMYLFIDKDRQAVLDFICEQPLTLDKNYFYSDLGFQTLGFLVEAVSGMPMEEYARTEIYEPLGLTHTTYKPLENGFLPDEVAATSWGNYYEMAMVDEVNLPGFSYNTKKLQDELTAFDNHELGDGSGWRDYTLRGEVNDGNAAMAGDGIAGHAGLFSTASDLAVLGQLMLNGGIYEGVRIYDQDVIDEFTSIQFGSNYGYGFKTNQGFMGKAADRSTFGHDGFTGTQVWMDKDTNMVFVVLTNKMNVGTGVSKSGLQYRPAYSNTLNSTYPAISPAVSNAVYSYFGDQSDKTPLQSVAVIFDSNGGDAVEVQYVKSGEAAVMPQAPERRNYSFDGWFSDAALTIAYDFAQPVTGRITLYAKWTPTSGTHAYYSDDSDDNDTPERQAPPAPPQWAEKASLVNIIKAAKQQQSDYVRTQQSGKYGIHAADWTNLEGMAYQHDTMDGRNVQVRVQIDQTDKITADVMLSAYVKGKQVDNTRRIFEKWFANKIQVIHFDQSGSWGQKVEVAANVNLEGMDTKNLCVYSYNKDTNTYVLIEDSQYWVDSNGYLHFSTELAGDIIISQSLFEHKDA